MKPNSYFGWIAAILSVGVAISLLYILGVERQALQEVGDEVVARNKISKPRNSTSPPTAPAPAQPTGSSTPEGPVRRKKPGSLVMQADNLARGELSRTAEGRKLSVSIDKNYLLIEYRAFLAHYQDRPIVSDRFISILLEQKLVILNAPSNDLSARMAAVTVADEKLKQLLGTDDFVNLAEFRKTNSIRSEFDDLDVGLRYGISALSAAQLDQLTGILSKIPGGEKMQMNPGSAFPAEFLTAASSVLNDEQMSKLIKIQEMRLERGRLGQALAALPKP